MAAVRPAVRSLWRGYLATEHSGYRPRVLAALAELLDELTGVEDRDELASLVCRERERQGWAMRLREPLRAEVLRPFVRDHLADPRVIWWALLIREVEPLRVYCRYDRIGGHPEIGAVTYALERTGEPRWWRMLLRQRLGRVDYGTHHLDEGRGVVDGALAEYLMQLCGAVAVADRAPAGVIAAEQRDELAQLWSLLRDWVRYDHAGRPGDFPGWCRDQGSDHWVATRAGTRHYYYQS
jgi:hypothetical protein